MYSKSCLQNIPLPDLSGKAAAEILDFLQTFTNEFENRYGREIHRYYKKRSRHNKAQVNQFSVADEPF
jgi:hypothetical protein